MIEEIKKLISERNLSKFDRDEIYNLLKTNSDWIASDEIKLKDCSNSRLLDELCNRRLDRDDIFRLTWRFLELHDVKRSDLLDELESRKLNDVEKDRLCDFLNML